MLKHGWTPVAALVLAVFVAAPGAAQSAKLNIATGTMFEGVPIEWGETTCVGGVWYGLPFACSPGTRRIIVRNIVTGWFLSSPAGPAAPYLPNSTPVPGQAGPERFGLNCDLDATYVGVCWGSVDLIVGEGRWVGAWHGKFDLAHLVAEIRLTARGEGLFAGRELKLDAMGPATGADFYYLAEVISPAGKRR